MGNSDTLHGINRENLDITVSPKDNFYDFATKGWREKNPLKPEFTSYGSFDKLREDAKIQLQDLIKDLSKTPEAKTEGSLSQKISDIYSMGMNEEKLNKEGAGPLIPVLDRIRNSSPADLPALIAWQHDRLSSIFFSTGVGLHPLDSDRHLMFISETGLGLGDRDYYLEKNETNDRIMAGYEKYVKRLFELTGHDAEAQEKAWKNVIEIETEIARHKMTKEERRDPLARFNLKSMEEIKKLYTFINWDEYFKNLGISDIKEANVSSPAFLEFMNSFFSKFDYEALKDYMLFCNINEATGLLSDDFSDASFEFYGRIMSGQEEKTPRWKRAMSIPNSMFGEALGKLYVEKYFPEENKKEMLTLVENLRNSLRQHIENLTWMSDETKKKALEKLEVMRVKIGYPDKWKDYSEIKIDPSLSYLDNVQKASQWFTRDNYKKLNEPVDKDEWHMTPQTVNAYYSPSLNEICFPAAILQPPYFDITADPALNYGAIGVIIGHEMTHGFDDQGRKFDKEGNLKEWWQPDDEEKFKKLTAVLTRQFNEIEIAPGVHANGEFTLGENIADQGGLRISLSAYADSGSENEIIDGFSPLQRFFLSYGGIWASNIRDEEKLVRNQMDPHSLSENRVNATLKNIDEFYEAFDIREGDPMFLNPQDRIIIW